MGEEESPLRNHLQVFDFKFEDDFEADIVPLHCQLLDNGNKFWVESKPEMLYQERLHQDLFQHAAHLRSQWRTCQLRQGLQQSARQVRGKVSQTDSRLCQKEHLPEGEGKRPIYGQGLRVPIYLSG